MKITSFITVFSLTIPPSLSFLFPHTPRKLEPFLSTLSENDETATPTPIPIPTQPTLDPNAIQLKSQILSLANSTNRGFTATSSERKLARDLVEKLSKYNPTLEPASSYYENPPIEQEEGSILSGKWTLKYTDAPDITTLDGGFFSNAKLGRIGQECDPPFVKNVIEWKRPDWARSLPLSGSEDSRVIQKVCCEAKVVPEKPLELDLKLIGLDLIGFGSDDGGVGPAELLEQNPVELRGVLKAPFGKAEILYLDEDLRVIKTYQGYLAVNVRDEEEWF